MFWKKKPAVAEAAPVIEGLSGPRSVGGLVGRHLISEMGYDRDRVWQLKSVIRPQDGNPLRVSFRVFDGDRVKEQTVAVKDFHSLDNHPDLILYEGWYDKEDEKVHLLQRPNNIVPITAAASVQQKSPPPEENPFRIYTEKEIQEKITQLITPGSTTCFYLAGSPASGGPLERGAAVIELNPDYPGKKQKKYNIYVNDVIGTQLADKQHRMFNSDSARDIAQWVKERHYIPAGLRYS